VPGTYKFYRSVADYGAVGDGVTDDTEAINAAIVDGNRCGLDCGNTFAQGALIYFPVGQSARQVDFADGRAAGGKANVLTPVVRKIPGQHTDHPVIYPDPLYRDWK